MCIRDSPRNDALGRATNRVAIHPRRSSHHRTAKTGRAKCQWSGEPALELSFIVSVQEILEGRSIVPVGIAGDPRHDAVA